MMKKVLFIATLMCCLMLAYNANASSICLQSSGGLTFNVDLNFTTGNGHGTYSSSGGNGSAYLTYSSTSGAFLLTWLAIDPLCSGIYQGKWIGNGSSATFENDCGTTGTRTLSLCTEAVDQDTDVPDDN